MVTSKLIEIGLQPDAGIHLAPRLDEDIAMREGQDMKRLRDVAVALLGDEKGAMFAALVS